MCFVFSLKFFLISLFVKITLFFVDPSDNESLPRSFIPPNKYGLPHSTPPVSPTEDDLSFVLGTVSLTRGRSHNTTASQKLNSSNPEKTKIQHQDIARTISDPHNIPRKR